MVFISGGVYFRLCLFPVVFISGDVYFRWCLFQVVFISGGVLFQVVFISGGVYSLQFGLLFCPLHVP